MNRKQKMVLWIGILAMVGMLLYPPYRRIVRNNKYGIFYDNLEYCWLFSDPYGLIKKKKEPDDPFPPNWYYERVYYANAQINWHRLGFQSAILFIPIAGLLLTFRSPATKPHKE